ncbi:diguanylate cyclase [Desulfovibrio aerotolerans]|uniref:diguanylate cyclase n=1 Tax=Solidesulfovibrio aerotolerans TaxID=295255 RepID=A0A7C9MNW8_9BACT|nr:sensor domain-containing diguanylate cyclase [Solidesulfovibrio aerotolerans]MYL83132.1 diguanylate cyclase [Solidesulfovibrio aerotolerans]
MMENALFESHFDLIPFGIYVVDAASNDIIYCNSAFIEHFGNHVGCCCHNALYERPVPCPWCYVQELMTDQGLPNGETRVFEHFNESDDRWYQMQVRAMTWPDGRVVRYAIAVDITELKATQNQLAEAHARLALTNLELVRLSTTDMLTGLANRQHTETLLEAALAALARDGKPFSLIMLDIDNFKAINDHHGHLRGDDVLRALAGLLRDAGTQGPAVGRWGGEEFLVGCPGLHLADAYVLAESLRRAISCLDLSGIGRITCSFGVTEARAGDSPVHLLTRADQALYMAKALGRNRVETA